MVELGLVLLLAKTSAKVFAAAWLHAGSGSCDWGTLCDKGELGVGLVKAFRATVADFFSVSITVFIPSSRIQTGRGVLSTAGHTVGYLRTVVAMIVMGAGEVNPTQLYQQWALVGPKFLTGLLSLYTPL